jgi:hypothetical protein
MLAGQLLSAHENVARERKDIGARYRRVASAPARGSERKDFVSFVFFNLRGLPPATTLLTPLLVLAFCGRQLLRM